MRLKECMDAFYMESSQDNLYEMREAFHDMVENGEAVLAPAKKNIDGGGSYLTVVRDEKYYTVIYSGKETAQTDESSELRSVNINEIIREVFTSPNLFGLVVDPFSETALWLNRIDLEFFSGHKDPRMEKIDWGNGIPQYGANDLMTKDEIMDFGMEFIAAQLKTMGFETLGGSDSLTKACNFIIQTGSGLEKACVVVRAAIAPEIPELSIEEKQKALQFAKDNNYDCYFASVSFGSSDPERYEKSIALIGDGYQVNFPGLLKL